MNTLPRCPKCQSRRTVRAGKGIRKGGLGQRYACNKCGHYWVPAKRPPKLFGPPEQEAV